MGQHTEYIELGMKNANKRFVISIIPKKEKFAFFYGIDGLVAEEKAQFKVLKHWGKRKWVGNLAGMFMGCSSLKIEAQDVPNFSNVTSVSSMFNGCTSLESVPNINQWNLSAVQDIHSMFEGATSFNQSLEGLVIKKEGVWLLAYKLIVLLPNRRLLAISFWLLASKLTLSLIGRGNIPPCGVNFRPCRVNFRGYCLKKRGNAPT